MDSTLQEKIKFSMNLNATLTIQEIAKKLNISLENAFLLFMKSKTAEMLYDDSTKLWWDSPDSIAENVSVPAE